METLASLLLWCTALNYAVLLLWFLAFMVVHDWMYRFHSTWFRISVEQFDAIHYAGMTVCYRQPLMAPRKPVLLSGSGQSNILSPHPPTPHRGSQDAGQEKERSGS